MAILLSASTIYCRYHYVVDVIAGLATGGLLVLVGNKLYQRFSLKHDVPGPR
jgi:membrane-associated phospholipid phosphatase